MLLIIFSIFAIVTAILIITLVASLWIHKNKRGSKIWNFVNKHIITDEDEYLKNK
jgi:hypothetical protein